MSRRYLFLCPEIAGSSGGIAVLYDCVSELRAAGYDACVVQTSASWRYSNTHVTVPVAYTHAPRIAESRHVSLRRRVAVRSGLLLETLRSGPNPRLAVQRNDVLVVPEVLLPSAMEAFPDQQKVVFVQNSFTYLLSRAIAAGRGLDPARGVLLSIGIADTCMEALDLAGAAPAVLCPVGPNFDLFPFRQDKKRQIAYMPRKRSWEAGQIHEALVRRGRIQGFDIVTVDGMTQAQVAKSLGESLIFISLMKEEALGFPALEAMASGCVVVGYTGLGTREYFTPETGIPIEEGDTPALVRAVESAVAEYEADPSRLDGMRREASRSVTARYSREAFRSGLLQAWALIDA
jgi:glycosyltransferase involved in cell wall biosynthesis